MDLAKSLANIAFSLYFSQTLWEFCFWILWFIFFLTLRAAWVMVEFLISVYIVMNFRQLRGVLLGWKLLAGSMVLISPCYIPSHIGIVCFLPFPWSSEKMNVELVAFSPLLFSQSHSLFLKTGENFKDQEEHMVFKTVRLFETPSLGKDLLTSLPVRSPIWLTCYLTQCVLDTPPASISLSREFVK